MSLLSSLLLTAITFLGFNIATASKLQLHDHTFTPDYILHVEYKNTSIACRSRLTALVNGSTPGPEIILYENRTSWIRVYNDMDASNLTIHWHGLSESTAPFSDGTPQASQWPIKPQHFFDYEIRPNIGEAGTYFYHSHVQFQAVSIAGPLIVREVAGSKPSIVFDEEKLFFVSELYNKTDSNIVRGMTEPPANYIWSGEAEAILVNGRSFPSLNANQSETPQPWTSPDYSVIKSCGPEVFDVEPGKTYRFRTIGGVALSLVSFAFEDHPELAVVAADGQYTQPSVTDRIQIDSGQRFDFLLKTKTNDELARLNKTLFWIQMERRYRPLNATSYAVLRYVTKQHSQIPTEIPASPPNTPPLTITNDIQSWLESELQPFYPNDFPSASEVNRRVYIDSAQVYANSGVFWTANNRTWTENDEHIGPTAFNNTHPDVGVPYLVNVFSNGEAAIPDYESAVSQHGGWDPKLNVYAAQVGEVIDIVLQNQPNGVAGGFDIHPWHIHGGHVYDLGSGPGEYDPIENEKKFATYTPVLRDTTILYKYTTSDEVGTTEAYSNQGWRAWRLRVSDAGVWMVHCHTLQHMIMGMQTVWVMGNASEITARAEPYVAGYLQYGGSAYGNATTDPLVYHHFD